MTTADCCARLQRAGLRITPAREAVIAAFLRERRTLEARDLIRVAIDSRGQPIKPATAYRVLRDLERLGLAQAHPVRHGGARWHLSPTQGTDAAKEVNHGA